MPAPALPCRAQPCGGRMMRSRDPANRRSRADDRSAREQQPAATGPGVANHASRPGPAHACFRDCIGAAWRPLTVAPMLRPRRAICVRRRLPPVIRATVGKHWIARPRLMLCLWKQRCCTSAPTASCTDSRTTPAMQRSRARRRDECSSSQASATVTPVDALATTGEAGVRRDGAPRRPVVVRGQLVVVLEAEPGDGLKP